MTYKLIWEVDYKVKETIMTDKPYGVCVSKQKELRNSTHTTGKLKIIPHSR
jgi:hypothetical protein